MFLMKSSKNGIFLHPHTLFTAIPLAIPFQIVYNDSIGGDAMHFYTPDGQPRPIRLSAQTRQFAYDSFNKKWQDMVIAQSEHG